MRNTIFGIALLLSVLLAANVTTGQDLSNQSGQPALSLAERNRKPLTREMVEAIYARYRDIPKGAVLEGNGTDFGTIDSAVYDKEKNSFLINDTFTYQIPVAKEELKELAEALDKDERIGVSINGTRLITYGNISSKGKIASALEDVDNLLGDIVLGLTKGLKGIKLIGDYEVKQPESRADRCAAFFNFSNYRFQKKEEEKTFSVSSSLVDVLVIPVKSSPASDGGLLPDKKKLEKGEIPEAFQANAEHVRSNLDEYKKWPKIQKAVLLGETAAFVRALKKNNISLSALAKELSE